MLFGNESSLSFKSDKELKNGVLLKIMINFAINIFTPKLFDLSRWG
jgi:hypothetical protein